MLFELKKRNNFLFELWFTSSNDCPVRVASPQPNTLKQTLRMSRRRGVVLSDDDESAPPPSRSSNGRSASRKERPRASAPEAPVPDLKEVAKLSPEEVQQLRLLTGDIQPLHQILTNAISVISDAAVSIEELPVSERNTEVFILVAGRDLFVESSIVGEEFEGFN